MKQLKQNPKTGIVEVWEDGKKVGEVATMGDEIQSRPTRKDEKDKE